MPRYTYGGQALIEGVLMRGRDAIAVALRHPDGRIVWATERLDSGFHGTRWSKMPLLRGLVVLYETLIVGTRWLVRSAGVQAEEDGVELGKGSIILMLVITLIAGIGVFFLLPLFIASATTGNIENQFVQHLVEGLVKVAIFLGYLWVIGQSGDIHRVFQYHGAEHMTIHALEHGDPLVVNEVRKYPTAHPRCGTEFLVVVIALSIIAFGFVGRQEPWVMIASRILLIPVIALSIIAFGFVGRQEPWVMIASRILLIPVIAAVGYEILKWGARHRGNPIVRAIMWPGILVQMITTKPPTDDMIEVAIVSMEQALDADGEAIPAGSAMFERDPLPAGRDEGDAASQPGQPNPLPRTAETEAATPVTLDPPLPGA